MLCPLGECDGTPHMIGLDGSLRHTKPFMMPELQKLGWRKVDNPKRNYYPEYDSTNPSYQNETLVEDSDSLPLIKL
jgi:hypothetical protein